jgi:formiminotetrahydrofolate cyclodeaminase
MDEPALDLRVGSLLERVGDTGSPIAASAVAAVTVSAAAGLVAMSARRNEGWREAGATAAQADALRRRAAELVDRSAGAYRAAVERLAGDGEGEPQDQRDWQLGEALREAAAAPLDIARVAADVGHLAAAAASGCDETTGADAVVAATLAEGVARSCAHLVTINLAAMQDDARLLEAEKLSASAMESRRSALQSAR